MTLKTAGQVVGVGGLLGFIYRADPNMLVQHMSVIAQSQIAQAGFFFTLAAWLHAGRVKKEIKDSFSTLITAMTDLGDALRKELKIHADQLADHAIKLDKLGSAVSELSSKAKQGDKP